MEAAYVKHSADNIVGALTDVMSTLRFCERRIFAASDDHSMRDETERDLVSIVHVLAATQRLIEWEVYEIEKLSATAAEDLRVPPRHKCRSPEIIL